MLLPLHRPLQLPWRIGRCRRALRGQDVEVHPLQLWRRLAQGAFGLGQSLAIREVAQPLQADLGLPVFTDDYVNLTR